MTLPVVIVAGAVVDLPVAVEDLLVPVGEGAALALDLLNDNTKYYRWYNSYVPNAWIHIMLIFGPSEVAIKYCGDCL